MLEVGKKYAIDEIYGDMTEPTSLMLEVVSIRGGVVLGWMTDQNDATYLDYWVSNPKGIETTGDFVATQLISD